MPRAPWLPLLVGALIGLAAASCRPAERGTSGDSWDCLCVLERDDSEVDVSACAMSAGDAARLAKPCVTDALGAAVRFCDCIESTRTFCDLGECVIR